ncbi:hypothetical protein Ccrd_025663 [Cynara cardunculus var. scolymus]|uniref:Uncharacterized protein n=1 Tax=Cynara cardunculus var. scolymus TaxID=59895 RepID=A0A103VT09_CYNCS|nr:hypothetical protein Ccrd_025663 [Cynara cardunculus var. scolymus]
MSCITCMRFNTLPHPHHVRCGFHTLDVPVASSTRFHLRFHLKHAQITGECLQLRLASWVIRSFQQLRRTRRAPEYFTCSVLGSGEGNESQGKSSSSHEILEKLRRYGISGILSYGLLNTAYYLSAFLIAWFYIAPAPGKMGYWTAVKRFVKLMAMVWAGSQVTKLVRAGGALALAPLVDKGLTWFMAKFKFKSQAKAFTVIVGCCFGIAAVLFIVVTLLSA